MTTTIFRPLQDLIADIKALRQDILDIEATAETAEEVRVCRRVISRHINRIEATIEERRNRLAETGYEFPQQRRRSYPGGGRF